MPLPHRFVQKSYVFRFRRPLLLKGQVQTKYNLSYQVALLTKPRFSAKARLHVEKNAGKRFFVLKNGIFRRKNRSASAVHAANQAECPERFHVTWTTLRQPRNGLPGRIRLKFGRAAPLSSAPGIFRQSDARRRFVCGRFVYTIFIQFLVFSLYMQMKVFIAQSIFKAM